MLRDFRIRRRPVLILLLPVLLFSWMVGWVLFYSGSQSNQQRKASATVNAEGLEFRVGLLEEDVEVKS